MIDILDIPFFYNLRHLVAGNQELTKKYIKTNYLIFNCNSILDIGCGTGYFSNLFSKDKYSGIDINKKYIEFAKKKYQGYCFIKSDILSFSLLNKHYDSAILISVLHHLSDAEINKILSKIIDKINKIIIIVDLNPKTSLLKKLLIDLDRGKYIRTTNQKIKLLSQFGKIKNIEDFSTRLASQTGMILFPKKYKT